MELVKDFLQNCAADLPTLHKGGGGVVVEVLEVVGTTSGFVQKEGNMFCRGLIRSCCKQNPMHARSIQLQLQRRCFRSHNQLYLPLHSSHIQDKETSLSIP